jgi:DnaK suppressor protein
MTTTREVLLAEEARAKERMAALGRELTGIAEAAAQPGTDDEHDPEGATLAFEREHTAALLARAREQITEIDAAIGRLDDGTYGTCVRCGQPVGEDRLAARPAAATCIRCARLGSCTQQAAEAAGEQVRVTGPAREAGGAGAEHPARLRGPAALNLLC